MSGKRLVLDASVALKWRLRDEEATSQADALLDDFLARQLSLLTPTLFDYEIANALKVAVARGRLTESEALTALTDFQQFSVERYDFRGLQRLAFQLASQYQRSVYGSAYLALARSKGLWFYTGDKRLFNAVETVLPWVKWIGDYRFDAIPAEGET
ncbi:MAG: type II toxin-antitoxin system VapC family toxin [Thermodesulfobacteriota bacterium]